MSEQETKVPEVAAAVDAQPTEAKAEPAEQKDTAMAETEKTTDAKDVETNDTKDDKKSFSVNNPPPNMLKVRRPSPNRGGRKDKSNKFDPSVLGETDDPVQIRGQVEFYLSDANLPTDKFLSELTGLTENKPVPLSTICSFKRMRRFQPYSAVVAALKDSNLLVVEGEEGSETVKRKNAFVPVKPSKIEERSIYAKGFGEEVASTQFDLEAFFAQYGSFNSVRLRRGDDGGFKGSVFVEWVDKETADKFMAVDPKPKWKDHDLLILWKADYTKEKNEAIKRGEIQPSASRRGNHRGRGGRRDVDSDNWKERRDRDQKNGHRDSRGRGRGRGRGGRGRGGGRDRDDRRSRRDQEDQPKAQGGEGDGKPKIHVSGEGANGAASTNGKRAREDEGQDAPPAKKVDAKEPAVESA
ncbi:hypothetical protein JX265_000041 [Neoarthrinium moseri]|uniref:Uncharacterized protein n=1 Tax=Neoarthrinium moseri TaxID=1658444 RepID=A0A9P9WY99_9PEZI|nr:uncharacterized protein JN550_001257 [Neoarthrinium moseri]KAI1877185.1 hypothetical protein JN550_001257 [Neoarthrinium moseri]KAI1881215.1 hypothetical protein JX265_000041 [Neoarthrinium moseri]